MPFPSSILSSNEDNRFHPVKTTYMQRTFLSLSWAQNLDLFLIHLNSGLVSTWSNPRHYVSFQKICLLWNKK